MVDPVETYVATLAEVRRQVAELGRLSSSGGSGGSGEAGGGGNGGTSATSAASEGGSGWVVVESASTPAQLPTAAGCSVWPQQQWRIAFEILFCQCPPAVAQLRPHQADDLLFFAYTDEAAAAKRTRLFVRRRAPRSAAAALPADLAEGGAAAAAVDWRASVLLMVVLQTGYRLSLVTAPDAELLNAFVDGSSTSSSLRPAAPGGGGGGDGESSVSGSEAGGDRMLRVHHVTTVVHASPSRVPVNLDHSRSDAGQPEESYPDLCFAVDDCGGGALRSQVLQQPADCYCVLLHADVASSWRLPAARAASSGGEAADPAAAAAAAAAGMAGLSLSEQRAGGALAGGSSASLHSAAATSARSVQDSTSSLAGSYASSSVARQQQQAVTPEAAVVFSGFVSHQQLTAALGGQLIGDPVRQVLRAAAAAARGDQRALGGGEQQPALATCRVSMRGPGGKGAADVAVSSYPPAGVQAGPRPSDAAAGRSSRPGLFGRAQQLAQGVAAAARQAAVQAARPQGPGGAGAGGVPLEQLQLRCALMSLVLPVDMLADSILQAL